MSKGDWFKEFFGSAREALVELGWFGRSERREPNSSGEQSWESAFDPDHGIGGSVLDRLGPEHFAPAPDRAGDSDPSHDLDR